MNEKEILIIVESEFDHIFDELNFDYGDYQECDLNERMDFRHENNQSGFYANRAEVEKATLEFLKQGGKIRRGE